MRYTVRPTNNRSEEKTKQFPFMVVDNQRVIAVGFYSTQEKADTEAARRNGLVAKTRRA